MNHQRGRRNGAGQAGALEHVTLLELSVGMGLPQGGPGQCGESQMSLGTFSLTGGGAGTSPGPRRSPTGEAHRECQPHPEGASRDHERMPNASVVPWRCSWTSPSQWPQTLPRQPCRGLGRAGRGQVSRSEGTAGSTDVGDR